MAVGRRGPRDVLSQFLVRMALALSIAGGIIGILWGCWRPTDWPPIWLDPFYSS